MNCHDDSKAQSTDAKGKKQGGHLGHMLMMVLCCGLPILILGLVPVIVQFNPALGQFLGTYAWLLCPLLMVPMMVMMLGGHKKDHS